MHVTDEVDSYSLHGCEYKIYVFYETKISDNHHNHVIFYLHVHYMMLRKFSASCAETIFIHMGNKPQTIILH